MLILCTGMIRSGSTLQYNLASSLVEALECGERNGFIKAGQLAESEAKFIAWGKDERYHVVKLHMLYPETAAMVGRGEAKVCYIYRDIREVAASAKCKSGRSVEEFLQSLDQAIEVDERVRAIPGVVAQCYEEVIADMVGAVRALASYLGLSASEELLDQVAGEWRLGSTVAPGVTTPGSLLGLVWRVLPRRVRGGRLLVYDSRTLFHPDHISSSQGASGVWRDYLTQDEADTVTTRYRSWLQREGYLGS